MKNGTETLTAPEDASAPVDLPLENGDHLDQPTFHALYEQMPPGYKCELIGGIVYVMASPLKKRHGRPHAWVMNWLGAYANATPGTDIFDNASAILDPNCEPQPDACMLIEPECGGQTRENEDEYIVGAPELIVEVASSSTSIDLGSKLRDYERVGVLEYVVLMVRQKKIQWFVRRDGKFQPLAPGSDGVYRSEVFPGLWLDPVGVLGRDTQRMFAVLQQGLASPEHAEFAARLAARRSTQGGTA